MSKTLKPRAPKKAVAKKSTPAKLINIVIACTSKSVGHDYKTIINGVIEKAKHRYNVQDENQLSITTVTNYSREVVNQNAYTPPKPDDIFNTSMITYLEKLNHERKPPVDILVFGGCTLMEWIFPKLKDIQTIYNLLADNGCIIMSEGGERMYKTHPSYPFISATDILLPMNKTYGPVITAAFHCYFAYHGGGIYERIPQKQMLENVRILFKESVWKDDEMVKQFKATYEI